MRPTKYNKRITVQKRTKVPNDIGGWSNTWTDLYSSWASVRPLSGAKRLEYGRLAFSETWEVEMRKRAENVDSECQVIHDGKTFQIVSIEIDERVNIVIAK